MRWISDKEEIELGKVIIKKYFAWVPVQIEKEVRWLETVRVEGYYYIGKESGNFGFMNTRFVEKDI